MGTEELLAAVDLIQANFGFGQQNAVTCDILEDILGILQNRAPRGSALKIPVPKLLELQTVLPGSTLLEDMLSASLVSQLPSGIDGKFVFAEGQPLSTFLSRPKPAYMSDLQSLPVDLISRLLKKESWTDSTARIIVVLLYSNPTFVPTYVAWLNSEQWTRFHVHTFTSTLIAFLECTALTGGDLSQVNDDILHTLLDRLFLAKRRHHPVPTQHLECIYGIVGLSGTCKPRLVSTLQERIEGTPIMDLPFETTFLARKLLGVSGCDALTTSIVNRALQWAVRYLSGDVADSEDSIIALENLSG